MMQDRPAFGIGHNRGPATQEAGFRAHCWRAARAELPGARPPVGMVRQQVGRARALGLSHRTYGGVRAMTGRGLVAFLHYPDAPRVSREGALPAPDRLARLPASRAAPHLGASSGIGPAALGAATAARSSLALAPFGSSWDAMRSAVKDWLRGQGLPGGGVLMIGKTDHERKIMAAAGLAGSVSGHSFFNGQTHAV